MDPDEKSIAKLSDAGLMVRDMSAYEFERVCVCGLYIRTSMSLGWWCNIVVCLNDGICVPVQASRGGKFNEN